MSRRSRILSFGSAGLLIVAGGACAVAFSGTFGQVLAFVLIGLGCVLATGLVFLEVGLSEDRERSREAGANSAAQRAAEPRSESRRTGPRLDRMRGSRRRLR